MKTIFEHRLEKSWIGFAVVLGVGLAACSAVLGFEDSSAPPQALDGSTPAPDASTATPSVAVTVSASQSSSSYGRSVVFTAIVAGNKAAPTGTVTFSEGASTLGVFTLVSGGVAGTASITTSSLDAGAHTITATYGGDSTYAAGTAGSIAFTVNAAPTTTHLESAPNPSNAGELVTLTATVTSVAAGTITGSIAFEDDTTTLGSAPVANGTASFSSSAIPAGRRGITARYQGSANYAPSVSEATLQSVTGPNCQGFAQTCGATANADCCASSVVPGGTFLRGYDGVAYVDATHPATVSDFRLDTYEVTVGRFRAFVKAGKGTRTDPPAPGSGAHPSPNIPGSGWSGPLNDGLTVDSTALVAAIRCNYPSPGTFNWTDTPAANEQRPMNCVTWYEAFAFCAWDGGRLATEAEWNYAAAGGDLQRVRPWSDPPTAQDVGPSNAVYSAAATQPVGSKPPGIGRWGHLDLGGNVWEWTLDTFATYPNPCTDCASLSSGEKTIRGGGFLYDHTDTFSSRRQHAGAGYRGNDVGIRCARQP